MLRVNNSLPFIVAFSLLQINIARSQENPVNITESSETVDKKSFYPYFDINQYEQTTLFKASASSDGSYTFSDISILFLSLEQKIFPSLSGELTWHAAYYDQQTMSFRMRYYPNKRAGSKAEKDRINNFTGNYISAGYSRTFGNPENRTYIVSGSTIIDNDQTYSISLGRQQKVGKWGYYDARFPIQYLSGFESLQVGFDLHVGIGYGPTSGQNSGEPDEYLAIEDGFFTSKNTISLENPRLSIGEHFKQGGLSFSGEFQVMDYFSFVTTLTMSLSNHRFVDPLSQEPTYLDGYHLRLAAEIRRYLGVQKRLLKGKPVQKFTGTYVGVKAYNLIYTTHLDIDGEGLNHVNFRSGTMISPLFSGHFGWQQRMGKSVFFDVNIGTGYDTYLKTVELTGHIRTGILLRK